MCLTTVIMMTAKTKLTKFTIKHFSNDACNGDFKYGKINLVEDDPSKVGLFKWRGGASCSWHYGWGSQLGGNRG